MEKKILDIMRDILGNRMETIDLLNCDFINENVFDSIEFINLVVDLEDAFEIEFSHDKLQIDKLRNFQMIKNVVKESQEKLL